MTGLNTCSPTKRSGRPLSAASRSTDSEEVVLGEDRLGGEHPIQFAQQAGLDVVVLDDRLDHELGPCEGVAVGHDLHVLGVDLRA